MIRRCECCQTEIPETEAAWKRLCVRCFVRKKNGSSASVSKKYVPVPAPILSSELRTAVEVVTPRRPAPFGSVSELMEFLFSSEARAASAEQSVMRLEKVIKEMQEKIMLQDAMLLQIGLTPKKLSDLLELCAPELHHNSKKALGAIRWLENAENFLAKAKK